MALQQVTIDTDNPPLVDLGHGDIRLDLAAILVAGVVPGMPALGVATIRQGNTTLTIPLDTAGCRTWITKLEELEQNLAAPSSLVVPQRKITPASVVPAP